MMGKAALYFVFDSHDACHSIETGPGSIHPSVLEQQKNPKQQPPLTQRRDQVDFQKSVRQTIEEIKLENPNKFRLERFGKAMTGTDGWEAPGAILNGQQQNDQSCQRVYLLRHASGFDWQSLPPQGIVVDVGGGIGSTSMLLATAFSAASSGDEGRLKFIIQDRAVVCEMGEKVSTPVI